MRNVKKEKKFYLIGSFTLVLYAYIYKTLDNIWSAESDGRHGQRIVGFKIVYCCFEPKFDYKSKVIEGLHCCHSVTLLR
jgi:hypothetical protein